MSRHKSTKALSMKNRIVAVRLPKGLLDEMKDLQRVNHFMDISEEIRYVIRKYCIAPSGESMIESKRKEKIIEELNRLVVELQQSTGGKE